MSYYGMPGMAVSMPNQGGPPPVPFELPKNLFRYGEQALWSSYLLSTAAGAIANSSYRLFATQIGQVGSGFTNALSIAETNLKEAGRIPNAIAFDVYGLACQILESSSTADAGVLNNQVNGTVTLGHQVNIINNGVLSWDFTQTQVDIAPVHLIGQGGGAFGAESVSSGTTGNVNAGNMNSGPGSIWLYRAHPVALPGGSTFAILLRFGSRAATVATSSVVVKVVLFGFYKNAIEIG